MGPGGSVEIENDLGPPITVIGTEVDAESPSGVALATDDEGARALLALILTAVSGGGGPISGTVALDGPTLAALEHITVDVASGVLDLSPATLAALETINAVVSGTVALDAGTLAALENVVVSGSVSVTGSVEVSNDVGNPLPISGTVTANTGLLQPLTDAQLRAVPVPVSFPPDESGLTDAQLRASPVPVSGTVSVNEPVTVDGQVDVGNFPAEFPLPAGQVVTLTPQTDALTDVELRAAPVDVLGPLTDTELRATPVDVLGPLTDAELRAAPVPVSGTLSVSEPVTVDGTVALDAPTLAALEHVTSTVDNFPSDFPDAAVLTALGSILTELGSKLDEGGTVSLSAGTLAALENTTVSIAAGQEVSLSAATLAALETINAIVTGTVALDAPTLAALENITATISGSVAVTGPLTDAQLRAVAVPVSGTVAVSGSVEVSNDAGNPLPVTGSVTVSDGSGPLTVDGTVAVSNFPASVEVSNDVGNPLPVSGTVSTGLAQPLTDAQLRAAPVIVTGTADPTTPSTVVAFVTTVATAGTRAQLAANAVKAGILQAPSTNAGLIYVGTVAVTGSVFGAELQPGQATGIAIDNTSKIWVDASVNGDKCAFLGSN